jgi:hypothetical protein
VTTATLAALHRRGYPAVLLAELYPDLAAEAIAEAVDLENQLVNSMASAA